ncbi:MAG: YgeY family selenium metabolism-linked hydrolase [Deltaproteobacteria bacterium]|nr:YgeY family selenium metabolism-linked hydrolase [Deltaproteobacteria bacterium]
MADALEKDTTRILADLVRAKSLSRREKDVIGVIVREMERIGFDEIMVDGLGSVVGRIGNGESKIAFDAHIDTVDSGDPAQWSTNPFEPVIKDKKIWGRGTVDQKGGMASMLSAADIIKKMGLAKNKTIYFTGTVMEEDCDGLCWDYLINEQGLKPDLVVLTEPTDLNIYRGQRGRMEIRVGVKGKSSHGAMPGLGDNAVYKASRIALKIEDLNNELADDPFLGKGTVVVSEFKSSSPSLCAVPDMAWLHLDRRLTKGETREIALKQILTAAEQSGYKDDVEISIPRYKEQAYTGLEYPTEKYFPSWVLEEDSPWLLKARAAYELALGKKPKVGRWTFSTNGVSIAGRHDIPCLGLGPGQESLSHSPNEACPIEHLVKSSAFYAALTAVL